MSDVVTGEAVALDLRIAQLPSRLTAARARPAGDGRAYGADPRSLIFAGRPVRRRRRADRRRRGGAADRSVLPRLPGRDGDADARPDARARRRSACGWSATTAGRSRSGRPSYAAWSGWRSSGPACSSRSGRRRMIVAMFSARGKRLGDMAAGTVVLQERVPSRPLWTPVMPPPLADWAPTLDLSGLDDALALSVRSSWPGPASSSRRRGRRWRRSWSTRSGRRTTPPPPGRRAGPT